MELKDLFITPLFILFIYAIAFIVQPRVTNSYTKPFFIPALTLKIIGALGVCFIYQFYYGYGDTLYYYQHATIINEAFSNSFTAGLKLLYVPKDFDYEVAPYAAKMRFYGPGAEYMVCRIAAVIGLFCFNTFSAIAIGMAFISFSGMWAMYITFIKVRPQVYKSLAISIFYIPSLFFWGSGVLKDTLCIGSLGWLLYTFYKGAIQKRSIVQSIVIGFISAYTLYLLKVYILLCFLPAALFWVFNENSARIKNKALRMAVLPIFLVVGGALAGYALTTLTAGDSDYNIDNIGARSKKTADYLYEVSRVQEGSGYKLGELDGTIGGMVKLAPQAIATTLFRPFLWEAHNPVMLMSALEALYFLFLTLKIFYRAGVKRAFILIGSNPMLLLCFLFSLVFSASVGVTSNNFGTLVRYKIPMIPFYLAGLFILESIAQTKQTKANDSTPLRKQLA
jgi:hypothetical protein